MTDERSEEDKEVEVACKEIGDLAWEHFEKRTNRPAVAFRILVEKTFKENVYPISEWFDDEEVCRLRMQHHLKNGCLIVAVDRYEMSQRLESEV